MNPATEAYRQVLAQLCAGLLARLTTAHLTNWDPNDPSGSLDAIGAMLAPMITGTQAAAAAVTADHLAVRTSQAHGMPLNQVAPYAIPDGLIGSSAAGAPIEAMTGFASTLYALRLEAGWDDMQAVMSSMAWLGALSTSEPMRAAGETTLYNAQADDRLSGRFMRETADNPCEFCATIADRGHTEAAAGFEAHAHCQCTPGAEISNAPYPA